MNKSNKASLVTRHTPRAGEGVALDVVQQIIPQADGTSLTTMGVNLNSAPVPDRRYVADLAALLFRNELVKLIFAQEAISSTAQTLRSMLVITISPRAAMQFLNSLDKMNSPGLEEIARISGIEPTSLFNVEKEPEQTVAFAANMVAAAVVGREACLDFYHASPFVMASVTKTNKLPIDPVVRVDLRTSLLLALRDELRKLKDSFPADKVEE